MNQREVRILALELIVGTIDSILLMGGASDEIAEVDKDAAKVEKEIKRVNDILRRKLNRLRRGRKVVVRGVETPLEDMSEESVEIVCPNCKIANRPDAIFCRVCGHRLSRLMEWEARDARESVSGDASKGVAGGLGSSSHRQAKCRGGHNACAYQK